MGAAPIPGDAVPAILKPSQELVDRPGDRAITERVMTNRLFGLSLCALVACQFPFGSDMDGQLPVTRSDGRVSVESAFTGMRGRYATYRMRIANGTGGHLTGRLLRPSAASATLRRPAVLLQDGRELNSRAVDFLPVEFGDVVVLSLDYPEELPYELRLRDIVLRGPDLRRASGRIAPSFSRGADYLTTRTDVDTSRLVLVATSFAVPFAVQAAATDKRFVNVGLIYGAGRMADVLSANLTLRPKWFRQAAAWMAMRPFAGFAPERFVAAIAPRPILMVNGEDDPQMPRRAVMALYDAARQPKTLIWLKTGHLHPTDSVLVRALVDTTLARLPALTDAGRRR